MDAKQITRRGLFAGAGALSITAVLAACAPGATKTVYWDNWPYYIDGEADGSYPTLKDFEKARLSAEKVWGWLARRERKLAALRG